VSARRLDATSGQAGPTAGLTATVDRIQRDRPWLSFPIGVGKRFSEHNGGRLSAAVAFYSFFSLFPLLLVFVSVIELLLESRPSLRAELLDSAIGRLPLVGTRIEAPAGTVDGSLGPAIIGVAVSLWAGLGATAALSNAFSTVWDLRPAQRPNFLVARLQGLAALVSIALLFAASTLVGNASSILGGNVLTTITGLALNLVVNVAGLLLVLFFLTRNTDPWRVHVPGAIVGGIGTFGLQQLGGFVARRYVENSSDTYGTVAVVIGLLVWLHLMSRVIVLAAETNAVAARRLYPRSLDASVVSDADRRAMHLNIERVLYDEQLSPTVPVPASAAVDW
jgi:uncharacterized BrkB/YihY/UPF0761 family membrane protein